MLIITIFAGYWFFNWNTENTDDTEKH